MADIRFACAECGQHLTIDESGAGQDITCPKCGCGFTVPSQSATTNATKSNLPSGLTSRHDTVISYSALDKNVADAACASLEARGIRCWIAPRDIIPGTDWGEAVVKAIAEARLMVLVFSSHADRSQQVMREVDRAVYNGKIIVPFRIEDVEPSRSMEYYLSTQHWLDALTRPLEKHLELLADTVQNLLATRAPSTSMEGKRQDALLPRRTPKRRPAHKGLWISASALVLFGLLSGAVWRYRPKGEKSRETGEQNEESRAQPDDMQSFQVQKDQAGSNTRISRQLGSMRTAEMARDEFQETKKACSQLLAMKQYAADLAAADVDARAASTAFENGNFTLAKEQWNSARGGYVSAKQKAQEEIAAAQKTCDLFISETIENRPWIKHFQPWVAAVAKASEARRAIQDSRFQDALLLCDTAKHDLSNALETGQSLYPNLCALNAGLAIAVMAGSPRPPGVDRNDKDTLITKQTFLMGALALRAWCDSKGLNICDRTDLKNLETKWLNREELAPLLQQIEDALKAEHGQQVNYAFTVGQLHGTVQRVAANMKFYFEEKDSPNLRSSHEQGTKLLESLHGITVFLGFPDEYKAFYQQAKKAFALVENPPALENFTRQMSDWASKISGPEGLNLFLK